MRLEDLIQRLRERDPAAVLVPPAALARLVQNVAGVTWAVWSIPHSHCLAIDRATLHQFVEPEELALPVEEKLPETVLVLERPHAELLANSRTEELLVRYWRLLFHASVHRALEHSLAGIGTADLRKRIERIGPVAFEEARNVLVEDGHLVAAADDRTAYIEFVAFFLELEYFASNLIPVYFPSLPPAAEVNELLQADVDGEELYRQTRLREAPTPTPKTDDQSDESEDYYRRLTQSAERAAASGDTVLAAILHTKAARVAPALKTRPAQEKARDAIYNLVARLQTALGLGDPKVAQDWRDVLPTLLDKADQGTRPVEAALLYDLQRACLDAEQTIYTLDILEWLQSAGHKPIRRPLEGQRFVRVPEHLRNAILRLAAARLSDVDRQRLGGLLRDALDRAEKRLRERFRPVLTDALHDAGLKPNSLPERAALEKTVEELLDRISSAGYLGYADLRDAIARGQMKLADLGGQNAPLTADPLVRLDSRLAHQMDGVYRRAEVYTKALEFLTSAAFGTESGRWFTRNVALPFGGAFLVAEFVWLLLFERYKGEAPAAAVPGGDSPLIALAGGLVAAARKEPASPGLPLSANFFGGWNALWQFHLAWVLCGLAVLFIIRSESVQTALLAAGRAGYRCLRSLLWDLPLQIWNDPVVRFLRRFTPVQFLLDYLVKPAAFCALLWLVAPTLFGDHLYPWVIVFVAAELVINYWIGRAIDLIVFETARRAVELIRAAPAVVRWINAQFLFLVDALEWMLARADDLLRIRGRSGGMAVFIRALASIFWMPFAFFIRFYTVVLIEPMINPLKLPLSILFAKFVYPLLAILGLFTISPLHSDLADNLAPYLSEPVAWVLVIGTFWLSPDVVTYLFWEMRENWRLYRANRPDRIGPVAVGPHGETVRELLHVSFHSGTIPRLYYRLREAEREAAETDVWKDARTYRQALRGVSEAVQRFVNRDLAAILNGSPEWGERKLGAGEVHLGTNRIRVQVKLEGDPDAAWLEWEDRSRWLVVGCAEPGFLARLPQQAFIVFENALCYLYRRSGVDLVREQVQACLPENAVHFDFATHGLLVWYDTRESMPVLYDPDDPVEEIRPRDPVDRHPVSGPVLPGNRLIFARLVLTWKQWLGVWQPRDPEKFPRFGPAAWELVLLPRATERGERPDPG